MWLKKQDMTVCRILLNNQIVCEILFKKINTKSLTTNQDLYVKFMYFFNSIPFIFMKNLISAI